MHACALTLLWGKLGYVVDVLAGVPRVWHAVREGDVKVL